MEGQCSELLIEIGCEEMPASWLPVVTDNLVAALESRLTQARITCETPISAFNTPRRFGVSIARMHNRQADLEEMITGPPVSASFDPGGAPRPAAVGFARKQGVQVDDLLVSQPDTGEQALEIADMLVRSAAVDVIVVDSVAALTPKAEIEGEMGDHHVGLQARLMSQALRKLTANIKRSNTMVVFINQIRMKIGVMFGNPETTTGGNALKFYSSVRMEIRRIGALKDRDEVVGNQTRVKVVKNKLAPPFKIIEIDIMYGEGFSKTGELLDLGIKAGIVEKSGSWFSYNSERIGQGRENAKIYLKEHPDAANAIETLIRQNAGLISGEMMAGSGGLSEADDDAEDSAGKAAAGE